MRIGAALFCVALGLGGPVLANAPTQSLRPLPRPDLAALSSEPLVVTIQASGLAPGASLRPLPRPGQGQDVVLPSPELLAMLAESPVAAPTVNATAVAVSLRPEPRPSGLAPTVRVSGAGGCRAW